MEPVLRCEHLVRRFGDRVAVDDVGFEIAPGETYGLLGPNGAGKTTTIRMLCGLLRRDGGTVTIAGRAVTPSDPSVRSHVGYVPQELAVYPDLTAHENLTFFGRLYGGSGSELARRVDEVLELIDLGERAHERVDTYSGGMQRRLNIGAGLLHRPDLLVLDEPTVGVDPQSRHAILESVTALGREGMAVLYTTHYMEEAERLCTRVGIIDRGRLIAEGTRRELVAELGERDRVDLMATGAVEALAEACRATDGIDSATVADGRVQLVTSDGRRRLAHLFDLAEQVGAEVSSVDVLEPDLEAVFLHLTGEALRE